MIPGSESSRLDSARERDFPKSTVLNQYSNKFILFKFVYLKIQTLTLKKLYRNKLKKNRFLQLNKESYKN